MVSSNETVDWRQSSLQSKLNMRQQAEDRSESSTLSYLSGTSVSSPQAFAPREVVRLKARRRNGSLAEKPIDVDILIERYPAPAHQDERTTADTTKTVPSVEVCAVSTSMSWRGEDRHSFRVVNSGTSSGNELLAFGGVFDGHDGPDAAEYCARGLFSHVVEETRDCEVLQGDTCRREGLWRSLSRRLSPSRQNLCDNGSNLCNGSPPSTDNARTERLAWWRDRLQRGYERAFEHAQEQFAKTGTPPGLVEENERREPLEQAPPPVKASRLRSTVQKLTTRLAPAKDVIACRNVRPGGTTACTLSIVSTTRRATRYIASRVAVHLTSVLLNSIREGTTKAHLQWSQIAVILGCWWRVKSTVAIDKSLRFQCSDKLQRTIAWSMMPKMLK
jgi:hypothetical protein